VVKKAQTESGGNIPYILNHDTGRKVVIFMLRPVYPQCTLGRPRELWNRSVFQTSHSLVTVPTEHAQTVAV
jgi:hypothetical protein